MNAVARCRVMGILNVTPDSFSDGGSFLNADRAAVRAWQIASEGADLLDIGAESTRPGAESVSEKVERERLWPLLQELAEKKYPLAISLDSMKPVVVAEALDRGWVQMVNDVGGLRDPKMREVVRKHRVPVILMHMFGAPRTMQQEYRYGDVVTDLLEFFRGRMAEIGFKESVIIDPGIGFGKSPEHNLTILNRLEAFHELELPILVGLSRKSFIGKVLGTEIGERLEGGLAATAIAVYKGASIIRTHDVAATVRAVRMAEAIRYERSERS